jgi:hypothetical protein
MKNGGITLVRGMYFQDYNVLGGCHYVTKFSYMQNNKIAYTLK